MSTEVQELSTCPKCGAPAKETVVDRSFIMGEERNVCTYKYRPLDSVDAKEEIEKCIKDIHDEFGSEISREAIMWIAWRLRAFATKIREPK